MNLASVQKNLKAPGVRWQLHWQTPGSLGTGGTSVLRGSVSSVRSEVGEDNSQVATEAPGTGHRGCMDHRHFLCSESASVTLDMQDFQKSDTGRALQSSGVMARPAQCHTSRWQLTVSWCHVHQHQELREPGLSWRGGYKVALEVSLGRGQA